MERVLTPSEKRAQKRRSERFERDNRILANKDKLLATLQMSAWVHSLKYERTTASVHFKWCGRAVSYWLGNETIKIQHGRRSRILKPFPIDCVYTEIRKDDDKAFEV